MCNNDTPIKKEFARLKGKPLINKTRNSAPQGSMYSVITGVIANKFALEERGDRYKLQFGLAINKDTYEKSFYINCVCYGEKALYLNEFGMIGDTLQLSTESFALQMITEEGKVFSPIQHHVIRCTLTKSKHEKYSNISDGLVSPFQQEANK